MKIIITKNGETVTTISGVKVSRSPEQLIESHGYDPDAVEWSIKHDVESRVRDLEVATDLGGKGKNGIAHRIDDVEQRISDLEDQI